MFRDSGGVRQLFEVALSSSTPTGLMMPDLLPILSPLLSDQLKRRTNELRSKIVKANYNTQFTQNTPELAGFCHVAVNRVDEMDNESLSELFQKTVRFTTYDSYAPFFAGLSEKTYKASALVDLFAPGFPDSVSESSSTSSGVAKYFLRYNTVSQIGRSSDAQSQTLSDPLRSRTKAFVWYFGCDRVDLVDEDNNPVATTYLTNGSATYERICWHLHPEEDEERMGTFVLDHAAPYAAGFIEKWRSFLLIHALFAIGSRSLETIKAVFITTFVDMIRQLDMEFDMVVECIANGTIPDLDGISKVRHYLETNISPDPERAAELRRLGRPSSQPGWCARVWPNLRSVISIASGPFASSVPLAQSFLGPDVVMCPSVYATTEAMIGFPYDPRVLHQFKVDDASIFEFLDIRERDSINALAQLWEVQLGRKYEIVLTTKHGLWRYRLGDVVEICGFDPADGAPVIQFIERRNVVIRFPDCMLSENELRLAMSSIASIPLANWTAAIDERCMPPTIAFFVELAGDQEVHDSSHIIRDLGVARDGVFDKLLQSNTNFALLLQQGKLQEPTILIVRRGTFSDFLQLKLDEGSRNVGQVKVPVALPKPEYTTWFFERVVHEV